MIEIHKNSTYFRIYSKLSDEFIDSFCRFKSIGYKTQDALTASRITIQNHVAIELVNETRNFSAKTLIQAYNDLRNDTNLIEKAIKSCQGID